MTSSPGRGGQAFRPPLPWLKFLVTLCAYCTMGWVTVDSCPAPCSCQEHHIHPGTILFCTGQNLTVVPTPLPARLCTIYLGHNNLTGLEDAAFHSISGLKKLHANYNRISFISPGTFAGTAFSSLEVLDLSHNLLTRIPANLPESLLSLNLAYNRLVQLGLDMFPQMISLQSLYVNNNNLTNVSFRVDHSQLKKPSLNDNPPMVLTDLETKFKALSKLETLALNENSLSQIADMSFSGLPSLKKLSLANNQLIIVSVDMFRKLTQLQLLDLRRNNLRAVADKAFKTSHSLRYLYLSHNALSTIPKRLPMVEWLDLAHNQIVSVFEDHKNDLLPVDVLLLAGNPLRCDCLILWLKEIYDRREYLHRYIEGTKDDFIPTCASPEHVAGESWDMLGDEVFVCKSDNKDKSRNTLPKQPTNHLEEDDNDNRVSSDGGTLKVDAKLELKVKDVNDSAAFVYWNPRLAKSTHVCVQYYVFGMRDTLTSVTISSETAEHILGNLQPQTAYIVCISPCRRGDPITKSTDAPFSWNQCKEVATTAKWREPMSAKVIRLLGQVFSVTYVLSYSIIFFFVAIGCGACVAGLWCKNRDWAPSYGMNAHRDLTDTESETSMISSSESLSKEKTA